MRPCASRRESVALFASGACPDDQAEELRKHLKTCAGCREAFRRLSEIRDEHVAAAANLPEATVPARLLNRVASRIRAGSEPRPVAPWTAALPGWRGIVGWAVLLSVVVAGALWFRESSRPAPTAAATSVPRPPLTPRTEDPSPARNSLVSYRLALGRSTEALESLLSAEEARPHCDAPVALRIRAHLRDAEL